MGLTSPLRGVYDNLGEIAEAFAAAFAVERIAEFVTRFAELGEQITRTSAMLGMSTKEVQELGFVSQMTGGTAEGLSNAIQRLEMGLQHAQNPTSQQAQALKALGLSAKELIALPVDQQMRRFADAVSRFGDGGNKTAIVMAVMGRSGAQMIPVLDKGAAGFDEMAARADQFATIMSGKTVAALDTTAEDITTLKASLSTMGGTIIGGLAPAFEGLVRVLSDLSAGITKSIEQGGIFATVLDGLRIAVAGVAISLAVAVGALKVFWEADKEIVQDIAAAWTDLGRIIKDVFTGNFGDIAAAWSTLTQKLTANAKTAADDMAGSIKMMTTEIKTAINGDGEAGAASGGKHQAPSIDVNASQGASAAKTAIDAQIKVLQDGLAAKKTIWAEEAKIGKITSNEEYANLEAATQKEYEAERSLLQKELEIGNLSVAQKATINAKLSELDAKHNADMVKLDTQSVEAQQKVWEGYFNTIESGFNGQLRSLLSGQETFAQAMKKIFADLVLAFLEGEEKRLGVALAGQLAQTTATQTGAAARTAAEQSASSGSILATLANAVKSIFGSAGQTAAGVSAEVAPVAGPAAPAIGAAAGASTLATAMAYLTPHEVGSWEVPGVTPALLHPGEMVIPQQFAEGLRSAMSGAGGGSPSSVSVSVSAWDGASVQQWLRTGGANTLAKSITSAMNNNPSLRPSYEQ
ncbi:MAG: hypothetical protein WA268_19955 [Xanthobacteraceae bacterium]